MSQQDKFDDLLYKLMTKLKPQKRENCVVTPEKCNQPLGIYMGRMTLSQGHRMTLKIWKNGLLPISRTLITVESWNLYHIVANGKTFTATYNMMTLTLVQGHWVTLKMWKNGLSCIFRTFITVES